MNWTIPNLLSVIRVLAAPCVAISFLAFERPEADRIAVLIFIGAAATDYLDGWLARILGQESNFGRMLDPVADKAMVTIALALIIALYEMSWPIVFPAVLIMLREVLISGLREFLGEVKLQVTPMAKWKTTLQMLAVCLLLIRGAVTPGEQAAPINPILANFMSYLAIGSSAIGLMLLWVAMWITVVSGWDYISKGLPYIRDKKTTVATPDALPED